MFRTITAKYPGICRRCNGPIAIGDQIRYGGAGRSYHFASSCNGTAAPALTPAEVQQVETADGAPAGEYSAMTISYGSTPIARVRGPRRSFYSRFSSGAEVFTNARGRCEDAPCCGCCS